MILLFIQSLPVSSKHIAPFRLSILDDHSGMFSHFIFRPDCVLPKRWCEQLQVDRLELLNAPPFCDIAEEIIEQFQERDLKFIDSKQFILLKSLFRSIGFNFNVKPTYYFNGSKKDLHLKEDFVSTLSRKRNPYSLDYSSKALEILASQEQFSAELKRQPAFQVGDDLKSNISTKDNAPGVYFFYNNDGDVIYVGKAKYLRKRLQSHFSNKEKDSNIDYSQVDEISVEYTGNDLIAQLVESENIKRLQPKFNTQQINDALPYIINIGNTAKGVAKASIVRKDVTDNLPEKYFNRESVKNALKEFCDQNNLCRKHSGVERLKGSCSKVTLLMKNCVCNKGEDVRSYNERFYDALLLFRQKKVSKIYKLSGRNNDEEAFIYTINGIYQGYGFINKEDIILNENDLLGNLVVQANNYDTTRIISNLKKVHPAIIL